MHNESLIDAQVHISSKGNRKRTIVSKARTKFKTSKEKKKKLLTTEVSFL
jgi:hypothetical protein